MDLTADQILKLAPDDASAKAGKELAVNTKWVLRCVNEKALWGDCQGSGKNPYRTIVDLGNIAFKCTCPSRKFPCKHGLGLLLLYANNNSVFSPEATLPPHVEEWLAKRETKAEAKEIKEADTDTPKPVDEVGRQKRIEAREKKVKNGIEELRSWLRDVVRTGIANVAQDPYKFNQNITARMVDSQAGGLAAQLRKINKISFYKEGWEKDLTKQLSKIYLITESYKNAAALEKEWQQELAGIIGWNTAKEDVLNTEGVKDHWLILSKTMEDEGNITTERIWFYGMRTEKFALVLNFYVGNQLPQHMLVEGTMLHAEMAWYTAIIPQRALIKSQAGVDFNFSPVKGITEIAVIYQTIADYISKNPFAEMIPLILSDIRLVFEGPSWYIKDHNNQAIMIHNQEDACWKILSISKAGPFHGFAVYENERLEIHAVWVGNSFNFIK